MGFKFNVYQDCRLDKPTGANTLKYSAQVKLTLVIETHYILQASRQINVIYVNIYIYKFLYSLFIECQFF